jgi:hypothetical protein
MKKGYFLVLMLAMGSFMYAQMDFQSSLHYTRNGKPYWYGADTSVTGAPKPGYETLTGIAIDGLGCVQCHGALNADSVAYTEPYEPSCDGCHATDAGKIGAVPGDWVCFNCHSRQGAEKQMYSDVHRTAGMECWDCHNSDDMHGDGTEYNSMLEPKAINADCEDCHTAETLPDHSAVDPHDGTLHCTACHSQSVISCYNCHFNSQLDHNKRAFTKIKDFIILGNREKDGKVGTMSFQSLTYEYPADKAAQDAYATWVAIAPYTSHTTTAAGRTCDDCHANENITAYMEGGTIDFATWNAEDSTLSWMKGVVPFPYDFEETWKMEFINYTGATTDPVVPSKNWESTGEMTPDGYQLFFATPLNENQLQMLSIDFGTIWENFDVSLHKTRAGKAYWYNEPEGFESLTHVDIDSAKMGCIQCHDKAGGVDANGDAYPADYEATCYDCHGETTNENPEALQARCLGCHGRQASEMAMGFKNAHQDTSNHDVPYLYCWECHMNDGNNEYMSEGAPVFDDIHGHDTTPYSSMLEDGAMKASCDNCHTSHGGATDPHSGKVSCEACHAQTVISCYNCHFNSQLDGNKRAFTKIKNFMMLANRTKSNDVYPMSFQSLTFEDDGGEYQTWVAFGPYTPHAITKSARGCSDCHNNIGGTNPAIIDYNDDGQMVFAQWNDEDSTLSYHTGVVPMPVDYETQFRMDFITYNGATTDPVAPSKNWSSVGEDTWDGHQMYFATPLDTNQMKALGMETKYVSVSEDDYVRPTKFALKQNYPNPFNPSTTIEFDLPFTAEVTMVVYNVLGKEVSKIYDNEMMKAGTHKINFDASKLASGIYFYQIRTKNFVKTRKMFMLK